MDTCAECGYDYAALGRVELPVTVGSLGGEYAARLAASPAERLRAHVRDGVWSALEYACHVRDLLDVQRSRIGLALVEDVPAFAPMRRDERVAEERYNDQDPATVRSALLGAADGLAVALEHLDEGGWRREGHYNWPVQAVRSVEWIARHTVHELVHHLRDVESVLGDAG
ncbi:MAG TPA: DinB family protein [Acidimicrobiales bacterium]|nr:DinB family protein [Acidimicrobiales bacterium]